MKLNDLVVDVRLGYETKIHGCKAFKVRQLFRQIVERDSSKNTLFYGQMVLN